MNKMNKATLSKCITNLKIGFRKHSPEILTGIGIAGMITSTILAVKATPKAMKLLENEKKSRNDKNHANEKLTKIETIKIAWKPYIPAAVTSAVSVTCLVGASSVNAKRNAALATAYELSKTALSEYKDKVVETIGEKKEESIRKSVSQNKVDSNPVSQNKIIVAGSGKTLFLDGASGRYFESDLETVKSAVNELNRNMIYDNYISLSDFYDELNLPHTRVSDYLGWNLDDGLLIIDYSTAMSEDGRPCIVMDYRVAPRNDFSKLA